MHPHFRGGARPSWLNCWLAAPLHDYPLREEILFQYSGLRSLLTGPRLQIFEAGPGAGFAAHFLSGRAELMLADVAAGVLGRLENRLGTAGARTWRIDLGRAAEPTPATLLGRFDFAFTLDMFQYIADPMLCLRRFGDVLRPGGELLLTFPNQVSRRAGHVCWFERTEELAAMLRSAGFAREEVFAIRMRDWARVAYAAGHEVPLRLLRRLRRPGPAVTGVYDESWASHQSDASPKSMRWLTHAWWGALARVMALGGPRFEAERVTGSALGHRLVARAWRA